MLTNTKIIYLLTLLLTNIVCFGQHSTTILDSLTSNAPFFKHIELELTSKEESQKLSIELKTKNNELYKLNFSGQDSLKLIQLTRNGVPQYLFTRIFRRKLVCVLDSTQISLFAHRWPASVLHLSKPLAFSSIKGYFSAALHIKTQQRSTNISGYIRPSFEFRPRQLNNLLKTKDTLYIRNNKLIFQHYAIYDSLGNQLFINGEIHPKSKAVQLNLASEKFFLCNRTDPSQPLNFKSFVSIKSQIKANENIIRHQGVMNLLDSGQLIFRPVSSKQSLVQRKGIVEFVKISDEEQNKSEVETAFNLLTNELEIKIPPSTNIKLITNQRFDDYISFFGKGNLIIKKATRGNVSAHGYLQSDSGQIVDGRFLKSLPLSDDSRLEWNGLGVWPELKLFSQLKLTASVEKLFAQELARKTDAEKMLFRRRLPFHVKIKALGNSINPTFGFEIQQPNSSKASLNGRVEEKLNWINQSPYWSYLQATSLISTKSFVGTNLTDNNSMTNYEKKAKIIAKTLAWLTRQGLKGYNLRVEYFSYDDFGEASLEPTRREFEASFDKNFFGQRFNASFGGVFTLENSAQEKKQSLWERYQPSGAFSYFFNSHSTSYLQLYSISPYTGILDRRVRESGIRVGYFRSFNTLSEFFHFSNTNTPPKVE